MALFSERKDAIPLILMHGWPGSFLEFIGILKLLTKFYSPSTLPYHVIVPSLPGYGFSSGPPLDEDFTLEHAARILDKTMTGLGLDGYLAQGGDVGSFLARIMAVKYDSCKGIPRAKFQINFTR